MLTVHPGSMTSRAEDEVLELLRLIRDGGEVGGPMLVRLAGDLEHYIASATFPELVVETVTDDGETFEALRCPVCDGLVDAWELSAVDTSERWSPASDISTDNREVLVHFDERGEFGDTLYYLHGENHAVQLPEGWTVTS